MLTPTLRYSILGVLLALRSTAGVSFDQSTYEADVSNFVPIGTAIITLTATSAVSYRFSPLDQQFAINNVTGDVTTRVSLENFSGMNYSLTVIATDASSSTVNAVLEISVYDHCARASELLRNASETCSSQKMIEMMFNQSPTGVELAWSTRPTGAASDLYFDTLKVNSLRTNIPSNLVNANGKVKGDFLQQNNSRLIVLQSFEYNLTQESQDGDYYYFSIIPRLNVTQSIDVLQMNVTIVVSGTPRKVVEMPAEINLPPMYIRGYDIPLSCEKLNSPCITRLDSYRNEDQIISDYGKTCNDSIADVPKKILRDLGQRCIPVPGNLHEPVFTNRNFLFKVCDDVPINSRITAYSVTAADGDGDAINYLIDSASVPGLFRLSKNEGSFEVISDLIPYGGQMIDINVTASDDYYNTSQLFMIQIQDTTCNKVNQLTSEQSLSCSQVTSISSFPVHLSTDNFTVPIDRFSLLRTLTWSWPSVVASEKQITGADRIEITHQTNTGIQRETISVDLRANFPNGVTFCSDAAHVFASGGTNLTFQIFLWTLNGSTVPLRSVARPSNASRSVVSVEVLQTQTSLSCAMKHESLEAYRAVARERNLVCSSLPDSDLGACGGRYRRNDFGEDGGGEDYGGQDYDDGICNPSHASGRIVNESVALLPDIYRPRLAVSPGNRLLLASPFRDFSWTTTRCRFSSQNISTSVIWYRVDGTPLLPRSVFTANDSGWYYCQGKNFYGTVNSSLVRVEPIDWPHFNQSEIKWDVKENYKGPLFAVSATTSNSLPLKYTLSYKSEIGRGEPPIEINSTTGLLTVKRPLDAELEATIEVHISADFFNLHQYIYPPNSPIALTILRVILNVIDVDDNEPMFTRSSYAGHIASTAPLGTAVTLTYDVFAFDADASSNNLSFSIEANPFFEMDSVSGQVWSSAASLVALQNSTQTYLIYVSSDGRTSVSQINITISSLCYDVQKSFDVLLDTSFDDPNSCSSSGFPVTAVRPYFDAGIIEDWSLEKEGDDQFSSPGKSTVSVNVTFMSPSPSSVEGKLRSVSSNKVVVYKLDRHGNASDFWSIDPPFVLRDADGGDFDIHFNITVFDGGKESRVAHPPTFRAYDIYTTCDALNLTGCQQNFYAYLTAKTIANRMNFECTARPARGAAAFVVTTLTRLLSDCVVCPAVEESTPYGNFSWPDVSLGQVHALPCPENNASVATRTCEDPIIGRYVFPRWSETNIEGCRIINNTSKSLEFLAEVQISDQTALPVLQATSGATRDKDNLVEADIVNVGTILSNVSVLEEFEQKAVENVVEIVSSVLETSSDELFNAQLKHQSSTRIYLSIERIATRAVLPKDVSYVSLARKNFAIELYDPSTTSDREFSGYSFGSKRHSQGSPPSLDDELSDDQLFRQPGPLNNSDTSFEALIHLPNDVFYSSSQAPSVNASEITERLTFFYYQNGKLFQSTEISETETKDGGGGGAPRHRVQSNKTVATRVIGAIVGTTGRSNLSSPIEITFAALNLSTSYVNDSCSSWSAEYDDDYGEWTDYGCTLISSNDSEFTCSCTHLTNFAVLVDPFEGEGISKENALALSIISYIGCSLSLLGLTITVITYLFIRKLRKERPGKILINLCISMILGLIFFVAYAVNRGNAAMCTATAFLLHYFWLASICWMGVEGVNMYMSLVKVFGAYVRRFVLKAGLVAWGLPLVVVAITAASDYDDGYKKTDRSKICRLSVPSFYGAFYGVLAIVLIFDVIVFILVMRTITNRSKLVGAAKRKKQNNARMAVAISLLLGCNWIFAVTASDDEAGATVRLVFNYLFAITASFQGFLIAIFYCFLRDEVRRAWKAALCCRRRLLDSSSDAGKALNLSSNPASRTNLGTTKTSNIPSPVGSADSSLMEPQVVEPAAIEMAEIKESIKENGALGDLTDQPA